MNNPVIWVCSAVVVAILTSSVGSAQEIDVSMALDKAEEAREEVVRANILLTASETAEFWILYNEYRAELGPVQHELVNVVVEYSKVYTDISDAQATSLFDEWLALRQQQTTIKTRYLEKFRSTLSPKHAIRYAQLENKLDATMEFDAARSIPLVE
jgi:F0F1-type ATP synthase epsilon subunit